jgi:polysaccharide biosynthesis transport protein
LSLESKEPRLLPRQVIFPRELRHDEVSALISAADQWSQLVMLLLLSGASPEEAINLRWSDVDLGRATIRVGDESVREVAIGGALHDALAATRSESRSDLLLTVSGRPATRDNVDAQILCAALDAGVEDASQVTSGCLRHTYIAYLVRQGIRFADLTRLVGPLPAELVAAYGTLSPPGIRARGAQLELMYPALQEVSGS